ncbi:MAG: EAL domain-containing protein [Gammaproteobacteria bacterium]
MSKVLEAILERQQLHTLFQPILDGHTGEAFGIEALCRGPAGTLLEMPASLFAAAAACGLTRELERAALSAALANFSGLHFEGRLFLNVLPETICGWDGFAGWLETQLGQLGIDPHLLVLEVTEHGDIPHEVTLGAAIKPLRRLGCDIAIDDLGAGSSGLKTWSALRPEFVKVDRHFAAGVERDPVRAEILRCVVEMGRATGSKIVAEGIENRDQCGLVLDLGVDYLQGYLFGHPQSVPRVDASSMAHLDRTAPGATTDCAEHLAVAVPPVNIVASVASVVETFQRNPSWRALAVVEGGRPVGIVRRDELLIFLSRPLHPEVYNRKPVSAVMDPTAVQIDARSRLDQVSRLVTGHRAPREQDDFIITRGGTYLGMGRTIDLLRHITSQQIQVAKQANPLTGLPGNREIQAQMSQWVNRRRRFIACHIDLDHFKPFNDTYGYSHGDQVLLHVAEALARSARHRVDFVGHIGGDDFVLLLRSQDWSLRLMSLLEDLAVSLVNFHSPADRQAGYLSGSARDGTPSQFPLLSVSIAAMEVEGGKGISLEALADGLLRTKAAAKAKNGHACMLATGGRIVDLTSAAELPQLAVEDTDAFAALG